MEAKRVLNDHSTVISVKLTFSFGIFGSLGLGTGGAKWLEDGGSDFGTGTGAGVKGLGDGDRGLFRLGEEGGSEGEGRHCMQIFTCLS